MSEEQIQIPRARDLQFKKVPKEVKWPEGQPCNFCSKKLSKSILQSPRYCGIKLAGEDSYTIFTCSEKCSKNFKNSTVADAFIQKGIMKMPVKHNVSDNQVIN